MTEYIPRAFATWFIGFFPYFEIYVAVPAAIALGLDYFSAVIWSVWGNYTPALLIHFLHRQLITNERITKWFTKLNLGRFKSTIDRHGPWFVLVITPWAGIWTIAVAMKVFQMNNKKLLLYSFLSISTYAVILAALIAAGVNIFTD